MNKKKEQLEKTIKCPVCGVEKMFLSVHLKNAHGLSKEEAKSKFGLEHLSSELFRYNRSGKNNSFYGKSHTKETKDKIAITKVGKPAKSKERGLCQCGCGERVKKPGSKYCAGHATRGLLVGDKNPAKRPEVREKLVKNHASRGPNAEERARKISESKKGKKRVDMLNNRFLGISKEEEQQAVSKMRDAILELWQDSDYIEKQMKARCVSQNKREKELELLLEMLFPGEFKFVGDGEFILAGKCPDFVNVNGQKKIIELFGTYWHSEKVTGMKEEDHIKERVDLFSKYGYNTLIVWEDELKDVDTLSKKLKLFAHERMFNDCNMDISNEMMVQSDPCGDTGRLAEQEMTNPSFHGVNNEKM